MSSALNRMSRSLSISSTKKITNEDETESMELVAHRMGLIAPNGNRKVNWDWFMLLLVAYTTIAVPFTASFIDFTDPVTAPGGFVIQSIIDIFYILDVIISFRTTYYNRMGEIVLDKKLVRVKYFKTWFWPDVIASLPYSHIVNLISLHNGRGWGQAPRSLRLFSLLKLLRIFRLGNKIDRLSTAKSFRILQFTVMLLVAAHWYACFWFFLGEASGVPGEGGRPGYVILLPGANGTSWVHRFEMEDETQGMQYLAALYWSLTTLMKAPWFHPAAPMEFVGAMFMIIFGCVLFAYFIGNVTAVITAANAAGGKYRLQITQLKGFCKSHFIGPKSTQKLLAYQDALWSLSNGGTNRQDMLKAIPPHLQNEVTIEMYRFLLDACPFLYDCSASGAVKFLQALKVAVCDRGDYLFQAGSLRTNMYILQRGEVKIDYDPDAPKETTEDHVPEGRIGGPKAKAVKKATGKDAMRGRTDKMGTLLGFHDVFSKVEPIKYSVRALSRCSLLAIMRGELKDILSTYPEDKEHFMTAIDHANTTLMGNKARRSFTAGGNVAVGANRLSTPQTVPSERTSETMCETSLARPSMSTPGGAVASGPASDLDASAAVLVQSEVDELRQKVDTLTNLVMQQTQLLQRYREANSR